jgi:cardiolipin synthase
MPRRLGQHLVRGGALALGSVVATQLAVAATVVAIDSMRKRRTVDVAQLSHTPPWTTEVAGSQITTYTYGVDLYTDMIAAIESARESVYLETFIWKDDEIGRRFKNAVIAAADRGVEVFVVYDGWANLVVPHTFKRFPSTVHVLRFPVLRLGLLTFNLRDSGRDHRKLLIVDRKVGFIGGYNIGSLYATQWRDTHLRVEGPSVWELSNAFVDFWNHYRDLEQPELDDIGTPLWDPRIKAHINAPSLMLFPVRGMYLDAINRASTRIWITQGYFIPDSDLLEALLHASSRGVDVRVLMPEVSNHVLADWLARGYYSELIGGGVQIWLYKDAMVHAKTVTVDGQWCSVGTANIDRLSLMGNFEINLGVYDPTLAGHLETVFTNDLKNSHRLTLEKWNRRGRLSRFSERVLAPLHPFF